MLKEKGPRSPFAKNTLFQFILQIAKYLFPFVTIPYLTRVLGPDVYAIRAYILAAMIFVQVFLDFGFNAYGTRAIALAGSDARAVSYETSAIVYLRLMLCALCVPVIMLVSMAIPIMASNLVYVFIAFLGACFKAMLPDFVFQGQEDMAIITNRFVVSQAVATLLTFICVRGVADLLWVPALETLAALIALVWSWANVFVKRDVHLCRCSFASLWFVFRESGVYFLSNAATTIYTSLTTLMIGIVIEDDAQISYWSIATTAVAAIQSLYTPVTNSLYPHMVKRRDYRLARKLLFVGFVVVIVGSIFFAGLSETVMFVLGGDEFLAGSYLVAMLAPVLVFSYPAMLVGFPVLAAVGKSRQLSFSSVLSAVFHVIGLFVLLGLGVFTIPAIAVLRCVTEGVLMVARLVFAAPYLFVQKSDAA